ncbi:hypothetical protein OAL23_00310 [bacterium]|nr:hypothetical protein [bacterium]
MTNSLVEPEGMPSIEPLVRRFFDGMDAVSLRHAVLRGAGGLPDYTRYDIDLLVDSKELDRVEVVLNQACKKEGWTMIRIIDKFEYRCCLAISPGPFRRYLPIDLFGSCLHRFYPIANSEVGLDGRRRNESGVWIVPDGFGAAVCLLKELTRHPVFKVNSREETRCGVRDDPDSFRLAVGDILGDELCECLLKACQDGNWTGVEKLVPKIREKVSATRHRLSPDGIRFFLSTLQHTLFPSLNAFVVVLGPDGSGKSTIADRVAEDLYQKPYKICRRFEYQFRLLPEMKHIKARLARLIGRKVKPVRVIEPGTRGSGMTKNHPPLVGMFYVTYYALDFILGHILVKKLRGQGALLMFARYFFDYYYQRGYQKVPRWYLRFLEVFIPKPDLVISLERDPQAIYEGKPELDVAEIARQQDVIRELVLNRPNGMVLDASGGIESTVKMVREKVERVFLNRHHDESQV